MSDESSTTGGGPAGAGGGHSWDLERYRTTRATVSPETRTEQRATHPEYTADGWVLFWMAFRTAFYSILTLGIYRFWMVTRLRRHYWGGIQVRGDPLEYTGRGIEKLLGFLLALVFLAVYLGLVNLGLTYVGLSIVTDDTVQAQLALNLSIMATLPLVFYAQYRGMRYLLSRTRWRGIRFGLDPGAWGYTLRACLLSVLTVVTAGLAYPYQHFTLAKYMTDRAWFGDLQFYQEGSWVDLFASWIWIYIMMAFIALSVYTLSGAGGSDTMSYLIGGAVYLVSIIVLYLTIIRYRFHAFKVLWSNRSVGDVDFESELDLGNAVGVYLTASFLTGVAISMIALLAGGLISLVFWLTGYEGESVSSDDILLDAEDPSLFILQMLDQPVALLSLVATYMLIIIVVFAVGQVFFTHRILRRQTNSMLIHNPQGLSGSQQRAHDEATEAGGFADALGVDVGAGF